MHAQQKLLSNQLIVTITQPSLYIWLYARTAIKAYLFIHFSYIFADDDLFSVSPNTGKDKGLGFEYKTI